MIRRGLSIAAVLAPLACGDGGSTSTATTGAPNDTTSSTETTTESSEGSTTTAGATDDSTGTTEGTTTEDSTTTTGSDAESDSDDSDTSTTAPPKPIQCTTIPGDHEVDCPEPGCAITVDVELHCEDLSFAARGLRVAPSPSSTTLVTSSAEAWYLLRVEDGEAVVAQDLPGKFAAEPIVLATDAEGRVALLADESERPGFSGGAVVVHELDGTWKKELVKDNAYGTPVVDLEFAADGTAYAWVENDEPNGIAVITRAIDGTWTESLAETGDFVSNRFSIGADGVAVAFGRSIDNQYRLRTLIDGDTTDLGAAASYFVGYAVTPSPAFGLVTDAPPFAAAIQSGESIYVAWPDGDGYGQVFLPETGPKPEDDCDLEPVPAPCPDVTCPYQGAGVEPRDFALARTEDGALWITYVLTHYQQTVGYYEVCPDGECSCVPVFENDQSTVELVLVRVSPLLPTPELLLTLTIPDVSRSVDMRAHGTDLAVGVRVGGPGPFDATYARLLRIDTTLL